MPWRNGNFELPTLAVKGLLSLARLGPSDVFVDLGCGTGSVVIEAVKTTGVRLAIGVEYEDRIRRWARAIAIETLTSNQLGRLDFWYGDVHCEDFDYQSATVVYDSFEEDEEEISFYKDRFATRHLRIVKKDLPFVGYIPSNSSRGKYPWLFEMTFPLRRVRSKAEWARSVLNEPRATIDEVYNYYRSVLLGRGILRKERELALNQLERLVILRF